MRAISIAIALAVALIVLVLNSAPASADSILEEVEGEFMCQCGCSLTLTACAGTMTCDVAQQMSDVINGKIARGDTKDQIVQSLVTQYGEKILSSPPKQGFNLAAWVTPFAAVLGGGVFIYFLLRAWLWKTVMPEEVPTLVYPISDEERQKYRDAFEKEYGRFKTQEEGR